MKHSAKIAAAVMYSACSLSFAASLQSMDKEQVQKTLEDKTITTINLVTLNGQLVPDTVTIYFDNKGGMTGKFTKKPEHSVQQDTGKWEITNKGALCVTWQHWHEAKPICVELYPLKNSYVFVNKDTKKFETMIMRGDIKFGNQMK